MKKAILLCGMLLAMSASLASANGINLAWTNCPADGGTQNRNFACNTNTGSGAFIGSFVLSSDLALMSGMEMVIDLTTAGGATLPEWWEFKNAGSCRINGASIANGPDGANCFDWSGGQATTAIAAYQLDKHGPGSARFLCIAAVPISALANIATGAEMTAFRIAISNAGTVGTTCTGCSLGACIVFNSLNLTTFENAANRLITTPAGPGTNYITWQGGAGTNCPAATPTKNATWGSVKSLYR